MQTKSRFVATIVSLIAVLTAQQIHADEASKNAIALSKAMISKPQFERLSEAIVETGMDAAKVKISSEKLKVDLKAKSKELEASLKQAFSYDHLITLSASKLSKDFTDEELAQILAFYESAMGKKWTQYAAEHVSNTLTTLHEELDSKLPKIIDSLMAK